MNVAMGCQEIDLRQRAEYLLDGMGLIELSMLVSEAFSPLYSPAGYIFILLIIIINIQQRMNHLLKHCKNFSKLKTYIKHFTENYQIYEKPLTIPTNSLLYTSLFARSVLIARDYLSLDPIFHKIKARILDKNSKLTGRSCASLMESLKYFPFHGNETELLNKLGTFYEQNGEKFTKREKSQFILSYMRVMKEKAHSTVDFRPLNQKQQKFSLQKQFNISQLQLYRLVSNLNLLSNRQIVYKLEINNKTVTVRIVGLEHPQKQEDFQLLYLNFLSLLKKSDFVIFQSNNPNEKIIGQVTLEELNKMREDKEYYRQIYYSHRPKNIHKKGKIHTYFSLLMKLEEKAFQKTKFVINCTSDEDRMREISKYFSVPELKQCFGKGCISYFHELLYQEFMESQQQLYIEEELKYKLAKEKYIKDKIKEEKPHLEFIQFKQVPPIYLLSHDYWQFKSQFPESVSLLHTLKQNSQKYSKFTIVTSIQNVKNLAFHCLQAKYYRFPPYKSDNEKMGILSALYSRKDEKMLDEGVDEKILQTRDACIEVLMNPVKD